MNKLNKKKVGRVFIGPIEIAGYYANLAKGFKKIGVDCDYITYTPHPFDYGGESNIPYLIRMARFFNRYRKKQRKSYFAKAFFALPGELLTSIWAMFAIFRYDVFIFGFGCSLTHFSWDMRILKLLNKRVISNLGHGSESRLPFMDGALQSSNGVKQPSIEILQSRSRTMRKKIHLIESHSVVIGAPFSSSHFLNKNFINWFCLGVPIGFPVKDKSNIGRQNADAQITRILHSPSHPALKGSEQIKQAIYNLITKGYQVELVLIHGKPHSEVIREICRCDFVVDQIYSDTPMAGFATEAAWFGKPAVVGGYGFDYLKTFISKDIWPPSKTCHPDEIEQAIESLIVNREERLRLGTEAQKFVCEKWNPAAVARRYLRIIEGNIPDEWWLDPHSVTYMEGCGQPVERTKENIRQMVEQFGIESLQLSHRPDLEQAFLKFAEIKPN